MTKMILRLVLLTCITMISLVHSTENEDDQTSLQIWAMKEILQSLEMESEVPLMLRKGLKFGRSFNGKKVA